MMSSVNYVIHGWSSARKIPGVSLYWSFAQEENVIEVIAQDRVMDDSLKRRIKNQTSCTIRLFLLT